MLLGGGVFAVILKSFQFTTLFRDELRKVLFGDREWLASLPSNQLKQLLKNALSASIRKEVPALADKLGDGILSKMIPKAEGYSYREMKRRIELKKYDPERELLEITDDYELLINSSNPSDTIHYRFNITGQISSKCETIPCKVNSLEIEGKNYLDCVRSEFDKEKSNFSISYSIPLTGKQLYKARRYMSRQSVLSTDSIMQMTATRFTESMSLQVQNNVSDHIRIEMTELSIDEEAIKHSSPHVGIDHWEIDNLIFPGQGLMLMFVKK